MRRNGRSILALTGWCVGHVLVVVVGLVLCVDVLWWMVRLCVWQLAGWASHSWTNIYGGVVDFRDVNDCRYWLRQESRLGRLRSIPFQTLLLLFFFYMRWSLCFACWNPILSVSPRSSQTNIAKRILIGCSIWDLTFFFFPRMFWDVRVQFGSEHLLQGRPL